MRFLAASASAILLALAACSKESSDDGPPPLTVQIVTPASDVTVLPGTAVNFTGSVADGTAPYTYLWTFGGAAPDAIVEDPGNVTFSTTGTYVVAFTATDVDGRSGSDFAVVSVKAVVATIASPASDVSIYKGQTVTFQGTDQGAVTTRTWSFPGGTPASGSGQNPGTVTYNTVGVFTASYTASDGTATDTDTVTVTVVKTLTSIDLTPVATDLIQGNYVDYTVTATFSDGPAVNVTSSSTFSSSDETKVTVSGNRATALTSVPAGTVTITASYTWDVLRQDTATINTVPSGSRYTKAQIKAQWNTLKPVATTASYSSSPIMDVGDLGALNPGQLAAQMTTDGINWTNFYRWLAGLPANIPNNATNQAKCQRGAHVLVMLNHLNLAYADPHNPPLPIGATSNYQHLVSFPGEQACGESNIFRGWFSPPNIANVPTIPELLDGWMDDFGNELTLGHRRWILNPELATTAFGMVWADHPSQNHTDYAALMHILDVSAPTPAFDYVAFPSEGFYPKQCFQDPPVTPQNPDRTRWSFSVNSAKYDLVNGTTYVTVVRQSDGYNFPITTNFLPPGSGITPTIGFNPDESNLDETYIVTIHNIQRLSPAGTFDYSYWVNFFDVTAP